MGKDAVIVTFCDTVVIMGRMCDGELVISNDDVFYNPHLGDDGSLTQEELDAGYEEWKRMNEK